MPETEINEAEINAAESTETVIEVDPIEVIYRGDCPSLSGRSILDFSVGRHSQDASLHLAIRGNSGGGMWCKDWASASDIQDVVLGATALTSKDFHVLHEGRSINTGGFILSALKELGLVRVNEENTRLHEHVPATTFEKVVMARIARSKGVKPEAGDSKTLRRKPKEA